MTKVDYDKVELALVEGMRRLALKRLYDEAGKARRRERRDFRYEGFEEAPSPKESEPPEEEVLEEVEEVLEGPDPEDRFSFLKNLLMELDRLYVRDKAIYRKLRFPYRHLQYALTAYDKLTPEQWQKVVELHQRMQTHKKENPFKTEEGEVESVDQSLVETERQRSKNLRFNVRKTWLPS